MGDSPASVGSLAWLQKRWIFVIPIVLSVATFFGLPEKMFIDELGLGLLLLFITLIPILVFISFIVSGFELWRNGYLNHGRKAWAVTCSAVLSILGVALSVWCHDFYQIYSAKSYLEAKIPELERYKNETTRYPLGIEVLFKEDENIPYLVAHHDGFNSCSRVHSGRPDQRWYCALEDGKAFELSFGYEQGLDERPSYTFNSINRTWRCGGSGCLTDHD